MAANINRSFKEYGWCTAIRGVESGGAVENLPCHTFPSDDGGVDMKCPTEIAISDRREAELAKTALCRCTAKTPTLLPLLVRSRCKSLRNTMMPMRPPTHVWLHACRICLPAAASRTTSCIVRDKIGSFRERDEMERWLNDWVMSYVDGDPANSSQETKSRKPLAAAEVSVEEQEDNPGYYAAKFFLRPHYQLEGLTVSLRLVSKLPSLKSNEN